MERPQVSQMESVKPLVGLSVDEVERRFILATLQAYGWHRGKSAEVLGITTRTLSNKLRAWRIRGQAALDSASGG